MSLLGNAGIMVGTYNQLYDLVSPDTEYSGELLEKCGDSLFSNLKILILDECHVLFSDSFMSGMDVVKTFLRDVVTWRKDILVIGLSATTGIIEYESGIPFCPVKYITDETINGYTADNMICCGLDQMIHIVNSEVDGKTMVMCHSIRLCNKLKERIHNSAVLVSKSNTEYYTEEMDRIREYIIQNERLPDTYKDTDGTDKELKVLITTTTLREGFTLREVSGVKNIVCCVPDELHVVQFAGRCRYNFQNLIVVNYKIRTGGNDEGRYLAKSRTDFERFMNGEDDTWYKSVSHLVLNEPIIYRDEKTQEIKDSFFSWIKNNICGKRIYSAEDRGAIVSMAVDCGVIPINNATFNKAMKEIQNRGFSIESRHARISGTDTRYKIILKTTE